MEFTRDIALFKSTDLSVTYCRHLCLTMCRCGVVVLLIVVSVFADATAKSCVGQCGRSYNNRLLCQCNWACSKYGNCCKDYFSACVGTTRSLTSTMKVTTVSRLRSCAGKCTRQYDRSLPCQCNKECSKYRNCCKDYPQQCQAATTKPTTNTKLTTTTLPTTTTTMPTTTTPRPSTTTYPTSPLTVSDVELSQFLRKLWFSDTNYASEGTDYSLNLQGRIYNTEAHKDLAPSRLLTLTNEATLFRRPTYRAFLDLLDNYNINTGVADYPSTAETKEQDSFLREIMRTDVMKMAWLFLKTKGYATRGGNSEFINQLRKLWFTLYSRARGRQDSSGFEHVFVGEIKNGEITGSHNWLSFQHQERTGKLDYKGYLRLRNSHLLVAQYTINKAWKEVGTMLVGTSPEFEMAAYTICFLVRPNDACQTSINGNNIKIVTYDVAYLSKVTRVVGTAFPVG